jgi:hypothetical protein
MKEHCLQQDKSLVLHYILWGVVLPASFLKYAFNLIGLYEYSYVLASIGAVGFVDFIMHVSILALGITSFVGFLKREIYAFYCVVSYYLLILIYNLYAFKLYAGFFPSEQLLSFKVYAAISFIILIVVIVYYTKMKHLFRGSSSSTSENIPEKFPIKYEKLIVKLIIIVIAAIAVISVLSLGGWEERGTEAGSAGTDSERVFIPIGE